MLKRLILVAALAVLPSLGARAQAPERPVRLLVPFPPGGTSDIVARILASRTRLPGGVVVENKAGAGGNIGAAEVARAPADGTVLAAMHRLAPAPSNPALYARPGYDLVRDFAPVILTRRGAQRHGGPAGTCRRATLAGTAGPGPHPAGRA